MEVNVKCAECGDYLEEIKVEKAFQSDAVIYVDTTNCSCDCGCEE